MKLIMMATLTFLNIYCSLATAEDLTALEAETLLGQEATISKFFSGKPALLIVGFSKASQKAISQCADVAELVLPEQTYSAAVLQGAPFFLKGMIKNGIRSKVPEKRRARFLIFNDGKDELKKVSGYIETSSDDSYWIGFVPSVNGKYAVNSIGHGICDANQNDSFKSQIRKLIH